MTVLYANGTHITPKLAKTNETHERSLAICALVLEWCKFTEWFSTGRVLHAKKSAGVEKNVRAGLDIVITHNVQIVYLQPESRLCSFTESKDIFWFTYPNNLQIMSISSQDNITL